MNKLLNDAFKALASVYQFVDYLETENGKSFYARIAFSAIYDAINKMTMCLLYHLGIKYSQDNLRDNLINLRNAGYSSELFNLIANEYVNLYIGSLYDTRSFETQPLVQKEFFYLKKLCVSFMPEVINVIEPHRDCPNINLKEFI